MGSLPSLKFPKDKGRRGRGREILNRGCTWCSSPSMTASYCDFVLASLSHCFCSTSWRHVEQVSKAHAHRAEEFLRREGSRNRLLMISTSNECVRGPCWHSFHKKGQVLVLIELPRVSAQRPFEASPLVGEPLSEASKSFSAMAYGPRKQSQRARFRIQPSNHGGLASTKHTERREEDRLMTTFGYRDQSQRFDHSGRNEIWREPFPPARTCDSLSLCSSCVMTKQQSRPRRPS